MMDSKSTATEMLEETAACEALGANTAAESVAYTAAVAGDATGATRKLDKEMRETAGRLVAASPHMVPPADLRGRIVEATAPRTFKMEDYRKVTKEDPRFYKWGFYAAAAFLIMASLWNINVRSDANKKLVAMQNTVSQQQRVIEQGNNAVAAFLDPHSVYLTWNEDGKPFGRGVVNPAAHKALLIFPQELIPENGALRLTMNVNGNKTDFDTSVIAVRAADHNFTIPKDLPSVAKKDPNVDNRTDAQVNAPQVAGWGSAQKK
jgi:hypothetical protein